MEGIKAIIIDDEERARNSLNALLNEYCPDVNVVKSCANVPEAVLAINSLRPQIVFLDIEMPEYSGFELLGFFRDVDFEIIFVTAYNDYALRAFEVSAVDYVLKPVDIDKLVAAVEKARQKIKSANMQQRLELLKEAYTGQELNRIAVPVSDGMIFLEVADIMVVEADGAYSNVWMKNGSKLLVSKKLKFFEDLLLNRSSFLRPHRSWIINLNFVRKYSKAESLIIIDNNIAVAVARDKKSEFEQILKERKITL